MRAMIRPFSEELSMPTPLRLGIVGAANIARQFCNGVAGSPDIAVVAMASRSGEKAAAFAHACGIPRHHASYEDLLADPEIEAVYNPLPNDMHKMWTIRALQAGKHVLCEKPLCMSGTDAREMYDAARAAGRHLVEAYPYMSQPQTLRTREILAAGELGRVQVVTASFGFGIATPDGEPVADPRNIRLLPERGGGALYDAGTYAVSFVRLVAGARPRRVLATGRFTRAGVDQTVAATLEFPSGLIGQITTSLSTSFHRHAVVIAERGVIETGYSNHAPAGMLTLRVKRGVPNTVPFAVEEVPGGDGFRLEAESFATLVRTGVGWTGASEAESIDTALALEAIATSLRAGGTWVDIPT
jgi:predicted dehydrogenase